jgi:RHS repeat-associated protein
MVEKNVAGVYTEILYSPVGKTAIMNGQTTSSAYFPLPAGATVYETGSTGGKRYFWHKDWEGSVRFASTVSNRGSFFDRAYAPFGETYNNFGSISGVDFTGDTQDTVLGTYDTQNREQNPNQGRWISPDPAGLAAANFTNPQTWNRYAYVTNMPLNTVDPLGLFSIEFAGDWLGHDALALDQHPRDFPRKQHLLGPGLPHLFPARPGPDADPRAGAIGQFGGCAAGRWSGPN